ncbi:transposase [Streptomyces mirabilis]|uniref:transposase n=1 Tax=Streptomyces mirabilis TaxID=68239 RepID=UPI0036661F6A
MKTLVVMAGRDWLTVVLLPGYAPELNPVEGLWAHIKRSPAKPSRPRPQRAGDSAPQAAQGSAVPAQHPRRISRRDGPHSRQTQLTLKRRSQ